MNETNRFSDRMEPIGIALGALLVLVAVATLAGAPWATKGDALASALQVVGAVGTAAIGALLVWLSRAD
ncbi:hypothetical protein C475_02396 [Halosimplex carlsbadense 2-9-1]|uniref:DUF8123 domain-containing protein n=1 Tax=Halosimplex carlsbadense 2-9-1 TaxID=797114 RepID=M0D2S9_9EURY|nr:hypothetical protein [Halosimplex carlsbadense]ELZ29760.1 hypothetical protein C475_02396 [Halosimplex carlsbadense 2-9-1]